MVQRLSNYLYGFVPFIFLLGFFNNVNINHELLILIITIYAFFNIYIIFSEIINKTNYVLQIKFLKKNNINSLKF